MESKEIYRKLAKKINMPYIDLTNFEFDSSVVQLISADFAKKHQIIPVRLENSVLYVATSDPMDFQVTDDISIITGYKVVTCISDPNLISEAIDEKYFGGQESEKLIESLDITDKTETDNKDNAEILDAPIVRVVNSILSDAVTMGASDIHIEPFEEKIRVRYRIDGALKEILNLPISSLSGVVTRIKIISNLNIAETKRPQDGRTAITIDGKEINMRVSCLPTTYGEKVVIRLLNTMQGILSMEELGLSKTNMEKMRRMMKISEGVILLTGPTGSGKTTTLYAILNQFNQIDKNIVTLEDPVEFKMFGINQVQVNSKIDMTFANGLRSILRQDPDIIMLGEIRDEETAQIAIRAAVTGHVVLSTLHTNDTASSISRLEDMGIPKYMLTSSISGIVAQRLLRRICPRCKEEYISSPDEMETLGVFEPVHLYRGKGCPYCGNSGFKGRIAIHEILVMTKRIKQMVSNNESAESIKDEACNDGMVTLENSAKELVLSGITTISEMTRTTYSLDEE